MAFPAGSRVRRRQNQRSRLSSVSCSRLWRSCWCLVCARPSWSAPAPHCFWPRNYTRASPIARAGSVCCYKCSSVLRLRYLGRAAIRWMPGCRAGEASTSLRESRNNERFPMWIVKLALRRPYTFIVLALLLFLISPVMLLRTPVDIFPAINIPVISVIWTYTGLVPSEMSSRIVSIFERSLTTTVNGIEHIESQSLNGVAVVKVFLQPSADINAAISAVIAESEVGLKQFPPGITPPLVLSYNASSVPIVQLGLGGKGLSEQQLNDLGMNFIRPQLATIQGAAVPLPYGGKGRQVMVDIDSHQLMCMRVYYTVVRNGVDGQGSDLHGRRQCLESPNCDPAIRYGQDRPHGIQCRPEWVSLVCPELE